MYRDYWGLELKPFQEHREADFCYRHEVFQAALLKLRYVLENGLGAGVLLGGSGCGKTYLLRKLIQSLPGDFQPVIPVTVPLMNAREFLAYIAAELSDEEDRETAPLSFDRVLHDLQNSLLEQTQEGRHPLIVVDDADVIDDASVFRALQYLLSLREPDACDFSLILAGEDHLVRLLQQHRSLEGKIPIRARLHPLTPEETAGYVEHRLRAAGADRPIFEPEALQVVHELTGGVPLHINHLCELALLVGFADRSVTIRPEQVRTVAVELPVLQAQNQAA